ncbi:unnamed protein product [Medioppia subpectinata]|uniref:Uncharacterized protein n=1 Tax=Medioppia subpectinata TaxID=1979941 RepID=A0A7R9KDR1_9ACAR|nr:unnamed protein product [Medioppia subpectinata]CAG2100236.1 unnamed protein product [Medioppia subpectinata]
MICVNAASNDSNESAVSYSPLSMSSSSPVKPSLAIKQLLESPLIKAQPLPEPMREDSPPPTLRMGSQGSDTELDTNPDLDVVMVCESPDPTPQPSQDLLYGDNGVDGVTEVADSQTSLTADTEDNNSNESNPSVERNCLRRQTSVCVNTVSKTSSPRALAILKNAIKTSYNNNSNKFCDKLIVNNNNSEDMTATALSATKNSLDLINGCQSPPNHKLIRNSPFSRGSALLKAAKERMERKESDRSPKILTNLLIESGFDRQLTGILRKHELQSSPTSSGEPKPKKKKVLFAEPVVSSKLEFKLSPSPTCSGTADESGVRPLSQHTSAFGSAIDCGVGEDGVPTVVQDMNDKRRNHLVHQNSTFDKEFDANSVDSSEDSQNSDQMPILMTQKFFAADEDEFLEPSCGQQRNPTYDDFDDSSDVNLRNTLISSTNDCQQDSYDELFMCSQPMPESTRIEWTDVGIQTIPMGESADTYVEDPIVNVPMRLSLVKELYHMFGEFIEQHSQS